MKKSGRDLERKKKMTNFEKAFKNMTPAQRKKATEEIGNMMGMPPKKPATKKATTKKTTKK